MHVSLRPLVDADLDAIYEQTKDPASVRMAAFTPDDPADRHAFLVHMSRVRDDPSAVQRVIEANGAIAGTIGSFRIDDRTEVTYWIDLAHWGRGIASVALQSFLPMTPERPPFARAASDNAASLRVPRRPGSDASASIVTSPAAAERRSRRRSCVSTETRAEQRPALPGITARSLVIEIEGGAHGGSPEEVPSVRRSRYVRRGWSAFPRLHLSGLRLQCLARCRRTVDQASSLVD